MHHGVEQQKPQSNGIGLLQLVILLLLTFSASLMMGQNPYAVEGAEQARLDTLCQRIDGSASFAERLTAYGSLINTLQGKENFPSMMHVLSRAQTVISKNVGKETALEIQERFTQTIDLSKCTNRQRVYFELVRARSNAFGGHVNYAESQLLEILGKPDSLVDDYTRAEAHYMAAYCGYYTDQLQRAAAHSAKAAAIYQRIGDKMSALAAYDGTSTTYFKMGDVDSALHFARKGLAIERNIYDGSTMNLALNYAEALMMSEKLDSAFYYAMRANDYAESKGKNGAIARAQFTLGNINMLTKRYPRAIKHYERAKDGFAKSKEAYHVSDVLDSLSRAYASTGDFERAYGSAYVAFNIKDSLREDRVRRDNDMKVAEFERDQMKKELDASRDERELAKMIVAKRTTERVAIVVTGICLLLIMGFLWYRSKIRTALASQLQTEVDQRTAELRDRGNALEVQAQRLLESNSELERFAYIASHDLKTPLRNITSFLGLIERRLPTEARELVQEYLQIAIANARHMNDLITDVLEFSRLNADLQELAVETTVGASVEKVRQGLQNELTERNASLRAHGDAKLVLPKGTLNQLLSNLITNGLKYNKSDQPTVDIVTVNMGDRVRISVSDNGIGIAPQYHDRIFEVFRRLHTASEYSGTGVGLAACRKIALRLGGDIRVESTEGLGSTFTLDLPVKGSQSMGSVEGKEVRLAVGQTQAA